MSRDKIFSEKISTRINVRPQFEEALRIAREVGRPQIRRRPPVITDDMLHTVLRRKALGESVEQIQPESGFEY